MKQAEWKRAVRPLLPDGERWEFRGSLAYRAPTGRFLSGVLGEGSAYDRGAYVWRVSMPMFVPTDVMFLTYSQRIGGGSQRYYHQAPAEFAAAVASAIKNPPSEAEEMARIIRGAKWSPNSHLHEAAARCQVLQGRPKDALLTISWVAKLPPATGEWQERLHARIAELGRIIEEEGQEAAFRHVEAQVDITAEALGPIHS